MKVLLVSATVCLAWMFLVKPAAQALSDQQATLSAHKQMIVSYKERVGSLESGDSLAVQSQLEGVLSEMMSLVSKDDSDTSLHELINECAARNQISVSRIESIKESQLAQRAGDEDQKITGINYLVRVEYEGEYSSVIAFMDELVSTAAPVKIMSFRFIPSGKQSVRVQAEISSVLLTAIPLSGNLGAPGHE